MKHIHLETHKESERVIHVTSFKLLPDEIQNDLKLPDDQRKHPEYIYIGRAMPRYGLEASPLANPYKPGEAYDSIDHCLVLYKETMSIDIHINDLIREELLRIKSLLIKHKDIYLVCWCVEELDGIEPCHGYIVKEILESEVEDGN